MDARRYDRNADLLAQMFWHFSRMKYYNNERAEEIRVRYMTLLEECLRWNDELGQMAEKGLI